MPFYYNFPSTIIFINWIVIAILFAISVKFLKNFTLRTLAGIGVFLAGLITLVISVPSFAGEVVRHFSEFPNDYLLLRSDDLLIHESIAYNAIATFLFFQIILNLRLNKNRPLDHQSEIIDSKVSKRNLKSMVYGLLTFGSITQNAIAVPILLVITIGSAYGSNFSMIFAEMFAACCLSVVIVSITRFVLMDKKKERMMKFPRLVTEAWIRHKKIKDLQEK